MDNVEDYVNSHDLQRRDASDVIEEFIDEVAQMDGRCIDIGCGPGDVTNDIILPRLAKDAAIVGADISEKMIKHAKKKYQNEERLSFLTLDIQTPNLPNDLIGQYDNALSFYCFHWCQNISQTFRNIYEILRPGGKSLIVFLAYNSGFNAYEELSKNPDYRPYMKDIRKYIPFFHNLANPRAHLKKYIEEAGFEILHCSRREKTFVYKNLELFTEHALAVNPFISRIPEDMREQYKNELIRTTINEKILFTEEKLNQKEYNILDRYYIFVAYFRKPIDKKL
ncbi:juvenile hormone acid O-methyltransferase [Cephus cinctus]|uniref:Juvenile hormone acid O-methyltransferase n=1 Tax=Cephus cinctus TaxID=211228 RepID=A0AAJ7FKB8_CEPCN|nr:juvenile hormone acid O-methyltransferase [Cephus cinctus]